MTYDSELRAFWEKAHRDRENPTDLTGNSLERHCYFLHADIKPDDRVLCIGVGTGDWVRELAETRPVWALDVSIEALTRLGGGTRIVSFRNVCALGREEFDWALSLWVAPHMSDPDLQQQLYYVIQALKPGGTFAIHYNEPRDEQVVLDNRCGLAEEADLAIRAGMTRRRGHFQRMVECCGGRVKETFLLDDWVEGDRLLVTAHVVRGDL